MSWDQSGARGLTVVADVLCEKNHLPEQLQPQCRLATRKMLLCEFNKFHALRLRRFNKTDQANGWGNHWPVKCWIVDSGYDHLRCLTFPGFFHGLIAFTHGGFDR